MSLRNIRVWMLIFSFILIIFLVSVFGILKVFQKELNERTGKNETLYTTAKAFFTLNYDSDLERKLKAESMKHEYQHVSIFYQEQNEKFIPLTVETLEWAEEVSSGILGSYEKRPTDLIFMDREHLQKLSDLDGVSGFYSNFDKVMGIHVHPDNVESILETPLNNFQRPILHEYAHFATFRKIEEAGAFPDLFPQWFIEGIAEYVASDRTEVHYDINQYKILPLESITWGDGWKEARQIETADPYMQSYLSVSYLIQVYGKDILVELIQKTNDTEGFYTVLEKITGKPIAEFEQEVLDYYR
jgi:hypothetical protein